MLTIQDDMFAILSIAVGAIVFIVFFVYIRETPMTETP